MVTHAHTGTHAIKVVGAAAACAIMRQSLEGTASSGLRYTVSAETVHCSKIGVFAPSQLQGDVIQYNS